MIKAIDKNLQRGIKLLKTISDEQYRDTSVPPYFSSIGCNMRHVLDMFTCIFKGLESKNVDFSDRERNELAEQSTAAGLTYFYTILNRLHQLNPANFELVLSVTDDLGNEKITVNTTLGSALIQAHSHAIHHFASVGFISNQLKIELPDSDFGYNPSTPKKIINY